MKIVLVMASWQKAHWAVNFTDCDDKTGLAFSARGSTNGSWHASARYAATAIQADAFASGLENGQCCADSWLSMCMAFATQARRSTFGGDDIVAGGRAK